MAVDPVVVAASFLVATLIIGAIGVGLGILLAPRIGRLAERADDQTDQTDQTHLSEETGDEPRS